MGNTERTWLDAVRGTSVLAVARALGMQTTPPRGASGGSVYGCPACAAHRRHAARRDKRGALGVRANGLGFRCMDCNVSGDALDLVALKLHGKRFPELRGNAAIEVRQWFEAFSGMDLRSDPPPAPIAPPPPSEPVNYPPEGEVRAFWDGCVPVDENTGVGSYLTSRNLRPGLVAGFDLARALPVDAALPRWASKRDDETGARVPWTQSGHRLIVPLFDERGLMRSVLARAIGPSAIKSYAPAGFTRAQLVMACPFGRWLLATGQRPDWFGGEHDLRFVIAEGEIDFLTAATQWSDAAEYAPATLGVLSGSWSEALARRVPAGSTVVIATDHDEAGERYAAAIAQSLASQSVCLKRWEPNA